MGCNSKPISLHMILYQCSIHSKKSTRQGAFIYAFVSLILADLSLNQMNENPLDLRQNVIQSEHFLIVFTLTD
jgi:hypothetical protein